MFAGVFLAALAHAVGVVVSAKVFKMSLDKALFWQFVLLANIAGFFREKP